MTLEVIPPEQFKQTVWKNGQGKTLELAIDKDGCANQFDWRISIATVAQEGQFSNFEGYTRHQVLLSGNGMNLKHQKLNDNIRHNQLHTMLSSACYDGGEQTSATLCSGSITAFNLMTDSSRYKAELFTYPFSKTVQLKPSDHCFVYSHTNSTALTLGTHAIQQQLDAGHLLHTTGKTSDILIAQGEMLIVIYLNTTKDVRR